MSPHITRLPVVVIYPCTRCNCRCMMCDIWKRTAGGLIDTDTFARYLEDFVVLHVEWIVFSGGEPLMHPRLDRLCAMARARGIRTTIVTTGLLLERNVEWIGGQVDDVIVSLDGPPAIHDRIRGVPGAFAALERGVHALRTANSAFRISARCTVQRANHQALNLAAVAACDLDMHTISFLAADVTSPAFDHTPAWAEEAAARITLALDEIDALSMEIDCLIDAWQGTGFVRESPDKLRRIVAHFEAMLGLHEAVAPRCNAPWVSAVIETDGLVRPCFFHEPLGRVNGQSLAAVLNSPEAMAFRHDLNIVRNQTCRRCVCSLFLSENR